MEAAKHIALQDATARISEAGLQHLRELDQLSVEHTRKLTDGFCREVTRRLPRNFNAAVIGRLSEIWGRLQELLAEAFWSRSLEVCNRVLELSNRPLLPEVFGVDGFAPFIRELFSDSLQPAAMQTLASAVVDVVLDKNGVIHSALLDTLAKFVGLCSIGVHPEAYEEVNKRLQQWLLILDTHIVISWLCEGEPDHAVLNAFLSSWRTLHRKVAVPYAVAEETAYHAWKSNKEAEQLPQDLVRVHNSSNSEVESAFLRTFLQREGGRFSPGRWQAFIRRFLGSTSTDATSIVADLRGKDIELLAVVQGPPKSFKGVGQTGLRPTVRLGPDGTGVVEMRPIWDKQIVESALLCKRSQEAIGGEAIILSTSGALQGIMDSRMPQDRVAVKSSASIAFSIAMLPGSSLSIAHVRELLFDSKPFMVLSDGMKEMASKMVRDNYDSGLDQLEKRHLVEDLAARVRSSF